ncbi:MAG: LL-diaminopimelate aminotransferase, partial [Eggerthellaceae bacterium]|nr:LL-diaminopimelate aminotransferase [Eggerthellaceae bacterium]
MTMMNNHYGELKASYLFRTIDAKVAAFREAHPGVRLLRLGIGDVTQPLAPAVIDALHAAVADQAAPDTFRGYMPEIGADFLKEAIAGYYGSRGVALDPAEIFVSSGASDDLGDVLDIFARGITVALIEPAYPAYLDANIMAGNRIVHVEATPEDAFAPLPPADLAADVAYICSPNNPTGAVFSREKLAAWVAWARAAGAIIIFDAAYEAFVQDEGIPHSIFEIPGAAECAIEVCSLSKTAGFTGTRCGWTVVPKALFRDQMSVHAMWVRNRTTKTNGISYILQRGAAAVFTPEGRAQTAAA